MKLVRRSVFEVGRWMQPWDEKVFLSIGAFTEEREAKEWLSKQGGLGQWDFREVETWMAPYTGEEEK